MDGTHWFGSGTSPILDSLIQFNIKKRQHEPCSAMLLPPLPFDVTGIREQFAMYHPSTLSPLLFLFFLHLHRFLFFHLLHRFLFFFLLVHTSSSSSSIASSSSSSSIAFSSSYSSTSSSSFSFSSYSSPILFLHCAFLFSFFDFGTRVYIGVMCRSYQITE